ncbi:unnamed protein product, partial [Rotaria magnacalcarata]
IKPIETSLLVQSISILSTKESNDNEMPSLNPNKRSHSDETSELINISDISEPLTPSKRLRRSISSQESIETFR